LLRWGRKPQSEGVWEGKAALGTADIGLHAPHAERVLGMAMLKPKF